jgi:hypothetical protein
MRTLNGMPKWASVTDKPTGDPDLQHYVDISNPEEAPLIDSLLGCLVQYIK